MSKHEAYDKMLYDKINSYNKDIVGENAAFKPSGHFRVYIDSYDDIHGGETGFIDGINTVFPNIPGYVKADKTQVAGGEKAEAYDGFIDLDPASPNFGKVDPKHGFTNTRLGLILWGKQSGVGTWNINEEDGKKKFEAILNHPNTINSLKIEMARVHKWADMNGIDHKEIEDKLRKNNPSLANIYAVINENDLVPEVIGNISHRNLDGLDLGGSDGQTSSKEEIDNFEELLNTDADEFANDKVQLDTTIPALGEIDSVLDLFNEAPKQFMAAFGETTPVSLKYPHDAVYGEAGVAGQDHIVIEQFQYQPPQEMFLTPEGSETLSFLSGLRRNSNIKEYVGIVKMPIPNNLNFTNGVSWGDSKLNSIQAGAFFSVMGGVRTAVGEGNVITGLDALGKNLSKVLGDVAGGGLATNTPANLALSSFLAQFALGRAGINVDGNAALTRGTGAAINPNLELLFNGPKLRNFTFQFQFAPNDELDGSMMRKIQKFFKMGMSPTRNQDNLLFLGSPNVFRLRYRTQENTRIKGLPMHKICALTQCEINYAPDNVYQSYEDSSAGSSPIRTVMTLSFTELTPIFQDDYLAGSNEELEGDPKPKEDRGTFNDVYAPKGEGSMKDITIEDTGF